MALKISPSGKATFFIALLPILLFGYWLYQSSPTTKSVPLEEFVKGVSFSEKIRLKVNDILVGEVSVKHLFQNIEQKKPSWWEYYFILPKNNLSLIVNNPEHLEELRLTLAVQHTDRLKVILQDDRETILRRIWVVRDRYEKVIEIPIVITPCDEITRIIYTSINSIIKEQTQKQGETEEHIDLDEVFDMLLRDKIEPYIAGLDAVKKDDSCFKTFQLFTWLDGKDVYGFDLGEYRIHEGLQGLLDLVIDVLVKIYSNWERSNLSVRIIGYTDLATVNTDGIDLQMDRTGIDDWSKIENPLDVRYSGCSDDRVEGNAPVYISFITGEEKQIGQKKIRNNCELGAVRAYVAMVYLINKLGPNGVKYSYATGGIYSSPNDNDKKKDPKKRKINIEFTIKAAKTDK